MYLEDEPRQRVRCLVELFECITQYIVLVGLASYIHYGLSSPKVEKARNELEKPSLGSWVNLAKLIYYALGSERQIILLNQPDMIRKNDSIFEASRVISQILGKRLPKKIKLFNFLDLVVQFRNEKIGHGSLGLGEANLIQEPLESAITQWMKELELLDHHQLVHIYRVEWIDPHFQYTGTNLNKGTSISLIKLTNEHPITPGQAYLYIPESNIMIPLYPFFVFDVDSRMLYVYRRLGNKDGLILECPYEAPGASLAYTIYYDKTIITGVGISDKRNDLLDTNRQLVSKLDKTFELILSKLSENWLTDSQLKVLYQLIKLMEPPFYVVNIFGEPGSGKTFLGLLLDKQNKGLYIESNALSLSSTINKERIILDNYNPSRRSVRSLRAQLKILDIGQAIILTREKAQDDIPCLHLEVTERDIQIVKATLYRELNFRVPEGDHRNLWDCFRHLEEET